MDEMDQLAAAIGGRVAILACFNPTKIPSEMSPERVDRYTRVVRAALAEAGAVVPLRCGECVNKVTPDDENQKWVRWLGLSDDRWWCSAFDHACGPDWYCPDGERESEG